MCGSNQNSIARLNDRVTAPRMTPMAAQIGYCLSSNVAIAGDGE